MSISSSLLLLLTLFGDVAALQLKPQPSRISRRSALSSAAGGLLVTAVRGVPVHAKEPTAEFLEAERLRTERQVR